MKEGKSAVAAVILSIVPGVGHFYLGVIGKGLMFLIIDIVGWIMTGSIFLMIIGIPLIIILPIWAGIDAYMAAKAPASA